MRRNRSVSRKAPSVGPELRLASRSRVQGQVPDLKDKTVTRNRHAYLVLEPYPLLRYRLQNWAAASRAARRAP
ncbi:hypothetical protein H920_11648 [Fukomys damarensis]|uniref:Uncharacterized protein n=1 Tax=Fukomys damarensis TaxID=885580 RepID=A0A091D9L2_FUKDA|nr:hypothetical protein H920_11648 [Fukomys damarensis]